MVSKLSATLISACFTLMYLLKIDAKTAIERWETISVPANANPHVTDGCYDVQANKHANGEVYQRTERKFKYICVDGVEQVYACIGSARTNFAEIPVGGTLNVDKFWHKCTKNPNNTVSYTQEFSCKYKDQEYKIGEVVNLGFLQMKCEQDGYKVEGCFSMDENNGIVSTAHENGSGRARCKLHAPPLRPSNGDCVRSGKMYTNGETFEDTRIKYKCVKGTVDPIGCVSDKNRSMEIGEDVVENNSVYRCFRSAGTMHYLEYGCRSVDGPSCQPKPITEGGGVQKQEAGRGLGQILATQP